MIAFFESAAEHWLYWAFAASWQLALLVALVALAVWIARRASPRVRYALWLLVLLKVFLPPSLTIGWGVGNWGLRPIWNSIQPTSHTPWNLNSPVVIDHQADNSKQLAQDTTTNTQPTALSKYSTTLFVIWIAGCLLFFLLVLQRYRKLWHSLPNMELVDEGPLRIRLEKIALELGEKRLPELYLSDKAASPFLFGVLRPSIVLPRQIAERLSPADIESVLQHELSHWRWRDPWVGWLQVLAQGLFWFHPLVWLANSRLRHERECVCDETVLRTGKCEPAHYGETLLAVLNAARGRSPVHGSLVGVFEPGANIQSRLEEIMSYRPGKNQFGMLSYLAVAIFALFFLPMALPTVSADTSATVDPIQADKELKVRAWPWIAKTVPAVGATDIDPALKEIAVTFDRDMQKGMSWTGSEKFFMPPSPEGARAQWRDSRTCVLPVKLAKGQYYRVGINSTSFQNFKSADGASAPCAVIYFTTKGASKSILSRVRVPKIVKLTPENGAADVATDTKAMRVTFDLPMGGGMSWTGGGSTFPASPSDGKTRWNSSGKTCIFPVVLKPNHEYQLGLNSYSHINFQSKWGVPLEPVLYRFQTAGEE